MASKYANRSKKVYKVEKLIHVAYEKDPKSLWNTWNKQYGNRLTLPLIKPNLFADNFKNNLLDSEGNVDAVNEFTRRHNERVT